MCKLSRSAIVNSDAFKKQAIAKVIPRSRIRHFTPPLISLYSYIMWYVEVHVLIGCSLFVFSFVIHIYSTPKETHHLYAFTVVKKFNWR